MAFPPFPSVYRLVSYIFVYGNVISLVCGAVVIWYFSSNFEKTVGTAKHCLLMLAFAISLALLYLLLRAALAGLLDVADAEGFTPVAFAMLGTSIARSRMRRTLLLGVNLRMALVPWFLLGMAWFIPSSSLLGNVCGLLVGNIYGYGYCSGVDLTELTVSRLDQKLPFRLWKRIPGLKYIPASLAERRASQTRKLNPVPGSYPTQSYLSSPPLAPLLVPAQPPGVHSSAPPLACTAAPALHHGPGAPGESWPQNHLRAPSEPSPASLPLSGPDGWTPRQADGAGIHQAPGFRAAGAASGAAEFCRVHVG
ncbi:rhomboid domain-containing protein 2 isoform X2 [Varanus komodoensis]|nr:rhomboid domain-containing protein 2 isoform X2 [Varanus komodoensis]